MYDAKELKDAITAVIPATGTGGLDEDYRNISFNKKYIIASNDRICIAQPFITNFEITVPAKEFQQLIPSSGEVSIKEQDGSVHIKFGKTNSKLSMPSEAAAANLFESLNTENVKWRKLPSDLLEGLDLCRTSASREMSEPYLTCIYVKDNYIVASDEVRISEYTGSNKFTNVSWLMPAKSVDELVKLEISKFAATKAWFYFKTRDDKIFCARRVVDQYPDVSKYFKFKPLEEVKLPTDKMIEAVNYVSTMAKVGEDSYKRIDLSFKGNAVRLRGSNELGSASKVVTIKKKVKKEFSMRVNPEFFSQLLLLSDTLKVGKDRVSVETENFRHLMALFIEEG